MSYRFVPCSSILVLLETSPHFGREVVCRWAGVRKFDGTVGTNALATTSPSLDGFCRSFLGFRQGSLLPSTINTITSILVGAGGWLESVPRTAAAVGAAVIHLVIEEHTWVWKLSYACVKLFRGSHCRDALSVVNYNRIKDCGTLCNVRQRLLG